MIMTRCFRRPIARLAGGLVAALTLGGLPAAADSPPLPAGQVIAKVACLAEPAESYALYLPSGYTPERAWPVIFAFAPAARGHLPVERFREGAERFGYIVMGSNTSRNFDPQSGLKSITAMWADAQSRFRLWPGRAYTAGFSGGARIASALAIRSPDFAGVIACGATFETNTAPQSGRPGAFFGTAGDTDMNFLEMMETPPVLTRLGIPHRVEIFAGTHEWAPAEVFVHALGWLEIQALQDKGTAPGNPDGRDRYLSQLQAEAEAAEKSGDLPAACRLYGWLEQDLAGRPGKAQAAARAEQLGRLPEVKAALKREQALLEREQQYAARYDQRFFEIKNQTIQYQQIGRTLEWWQREIRSLEKSRQSAKSAEEERMWRRVLGMISSWGLEGSVVALQNRQYGQAALLGEIGRLVQPESAFVHYNLACAYSRLGQLETALAALQSAVDHGFKNLAYLEADADLATLRPTEGFQRICRQLRPNP